jgi:hypothetical protein
MRLSCMPHGRWGFKAIHFHCEAQPSYVTLDDNIQSPILGLCSCLCAISTSLLQKHVSVFWKNRFASSSWLSHWPFTTEAQVHPKPVSIGHEVDKVELGQVPVQVLQLSFGCIITPISFICHQLSMHINLEIKQYHYLKHLSQKTQCPHTHMCNLACWIEKW